MLDDFEMNMVYRYVQYLNSDQKTWGYQFILVHKFGLKVDIFAFSVTICNCSDTAQFVLEKAYIMFDNYEKLRIDVSRSF